MSVGLLLITHKNIATSLLETARLMLNACPLSTQALEVPLDHDPEDIFSQAEKSIQQLDSGNGVLVLTDIYGSTPSNIGKKISKTYKCKLVSGLNLPMLIRILNYPQLNLDEMTLKALSGGHDGILLCDCTENKQ